MLNPTPVTLKQPKARFQESGDNISRHRDLVDSREFQRAADFAMLQYAAALSNSVTDFNTATAAGFRLAGATELLSTLKMLSETPSRPTIITPENLDHNVK